LITDEFSAWEHATSEPFGVERLADALRTSWHIAPEEIIAELNESVLTFSTGSKQNDDLTAEDQRK
jgi:serine phosphatase RsbU (regulator of sigma subunit)